MKLSIEMNSEDWLSMCCFHAAMMEVVIQNMAEDPLIYSKMARITNDLQYKVAMKMPPGEIDRIKAKDKQEPY